MPISFNPLLRLSRALRIPSRAGIKKLQVTEPPANIWFFGGAQQGLHALTRLLDSQDFYRNTSVQVFTTPIWGLATNPAGMGANAWGQPVVELSHPLLRKKLLDLGYTEQQHPTIYHFAIALNQALFEKARYFEQQFGYNPLITDVNPDVCKVAPIQGEIVAYHDNKKIASFSSLDLHKSQIYDHMHSYGRMRGRLQGNNGKSLEVLPITNLYEKNVISSLDGDMPVAIVGTGLSAFWVCSYLIRLHKKFVLLTEQEFVPSKQQLRDLYLGSPANKHYLKDIIEYGGKSLDNIDITALSKADLSDLLDPALDKILSELVVVQADKPNENIIVTDNNEVYLKPPGQQPYQIQPCFYDATNYRYAGVCEFLPFGPLRVIPFEVQTLLSTNTERLMFTIEAIRVSHVDNKNFTHFYDILQSSLSILNNLKRQYISLDALKDDESVQRTYRQILEQKKIIQGILQGGSEHAQEFQKMLMEHGVDINRLFCLPFNPQGAGSYVAALSNTFYSADTTLFSAVLTTYSSTQDNIIARFKNCTGIFLSHEILNVFYRRLSELNLEYNPCFRELKTKIIAEKMEIFRDVLRENGIDVDIHRKAIDAFLEKEYALSNSFLSVGDVIESQSVIDQKRPAPAV